MDFIFKLEIQFKSLIDFGGIREISHLSTLYIKSIMPLIKSRSFYWKWIKLYRINVGSTIYNRKASASNRASNLKNKSTAFAKPLWKLANNLNPIKIIGSSFTKICYLLLFISKSVRLLSIAMKWEWAGYQ